jgi:hypothetical protein
VCRATPVPFSVALRLPPERRTPLRKGPGVRICPLDSTPAESKGVAPWPVEVSAHVVSVTRGLGVVWLPRRKAGQRGARAGRRAAREARRPARRTGGDRACAGALQQRRAGKKDGLSQDAHHANRCGCSSAIRWAPAYYGREASRRQAQLSEPQRSGPCPGKRQDAARNCRCM